MMTAFLVMPANIGKKLTEFLNDWASNSQLALKLIINDIL